MFKKLAAFIKRQPWAIQALAWPLYGIAYLVCDLVSWAFAEMTGQAKAKAKKTFAPLLWPFGGLLTVMILFAVLGQAEFMALVQTALGPVVALVMAFYGLKFLVSGFVPKKKRK